MTKNLPYCLSAESIPHNQIPEIFKTNFDVRRRKNMLFFLDIACCVKKNQLLVEDIIGAHYGDCMKQCKCENPVSSGVL